MQTNDPVFEDVKNYFSFALRGAFVGLDGITLSKIYFMFLSGIELISQSGQHCKVLPIGMHYCFAMHVFFDRPAPPWEKDPFVKIRFTGEHVEELLCAAKTNIAAWMAAKELAQKLLEQNGYLPEKLLSFLLDIDQKSKPRRQRGKHFYETFFRDFQIVLLLSSVNDTGLSITRNPDPLYKSKNSLCDAMRLALESIGIPLSFETIRSIWNKRDELKRIFQDFPSCLNF